MSADWNGRPLRLLGFNFLLSPQHALPTWLWALSRRLAHRLTKAAHVALLTSPDARDHGPANNPHGQPAVGPCPIYTARGNKPQIDVLNSFKP